MSIVGNPEVLRRKIQKEIKKHLATAIERERLLLSGMAQHFCEVNHLRPEEIELISKRLTDKETAFHFRKREGALIIPGKELIT